MNNNNSTAEFINIHPKLSLKKELEDFLDKINKYNGVYDFIDGKDNKEIKGYWDIVELCREIKKKMEDIYSRP